MVTTGRIHDWRFEVVIEVAVRKVVCWIDSALIREMKEVVLYIEGSIYNLDYI